MNNLTEFLKQLTENGNAKLIVKVSDTKYIAYAILINDHGEILANVAEVNYNEPLTDSQGKINESVKPISVLSFDDPSDKCIYKTIAKVISSNYQNEEVLIKSDNLKFDYSIFSFNFFYEIAVRMMMISNHDLVCSNCISEHKYLDKYLINMCKSLPKDDKIYTLEEIEIREKILNDRVLAIDTIAHELKSLSGHEYYEKAYKWINLYEDRQQQSIKSLCIK